MILRNVLKIVAGFSFLAGGGISTWGFFRAADCNQNNTVAKAVEPVCNGTGITYSSYNAVLPVMDCRIAELTNGTSLRCRETFNNATTTVGVAARDRTLKSNRNQVAWGSTLVGLGTSIVSTLGTFFGCKRKKGMLEEPLMSDRRGISPLDKQVRCCRK